MYNFDEKIDRSNTNAMKLEGYKAYIFGSEKELDFPFKDDEFIHMWVADMEYAVADEILDTIRKRLDRKILGYTGNFDGRLFKSLQKWCRDRYSWEIKEEELLTSDGVVSALEKSISYIVKPGDKVLINTPGYGQFAHATNRVDREYITSPLIKNEDGSYDIDFDDLDEKMGGEDVSLFIFCSPHNPTGRVWTKEELEKIADLVKKHNIWMISDEIHCDIRRANTARHIPFAKIMPDYDKLIICMAASKTFNLAGLKQSSIFVKNKELRNYWKSKYNSSFNPLSLEATIAAYSKGSNWLAEMSDYLDNNFKLMEEFIAKNLDKAIVTRSQATYLAWVDFGKYFKKK